MPKKFYEIDTWWQLRMSFSKVAHSIEIKIDVGMSHFYSTTYFQRSNLPASNGVVAKVVLSKVGT